MQLRKSWFVTNLEWLVPSGTYLMLKETVSGKIQVYEHKVKAGYMLETSEG